MGNLTGYESTCMSTKTGISNFTWEGPDALIPKYHIYLIMLNTHIFQILHSPPNVLVTNEIPEWSSALFMPRFDKAAVNFASGKGNSQPPFQRRTAQPVPKLPPVRFIVVMDRLKLAGTRNWRSVFQSVSKEELFSALTLHLQVALCSCQACFVDTPSAK